MSASRGAKYQRQSTGRKRATEEEIAESHFGAHRYPEERSDYEMYSEVYYDEDRSQNSRRGYTGRETWEAKEDHYDEAVPRQVRHIARIEITNQDEINGNIRETEQHNKQQKAELRSAPEMKRNHSTHKNARVTVTCNTLTIPPPPPAPSERVMKVAISKPPPNNVAANGMEHGKSSGRRGSEQPEHQGELRDGRPSANESSGKEKRPTQAADKSGRMIVVNMGRSPQTGREGRPMMGSNGKPATNPFLIGSEKRPHFDTVPPQQINNVQEVIQRMNSGDWPIKIEDDRCSDKTNQCKVGRVQGNQRPQEKAHNWETLQRNKPTREQPDHPDSSERAHSSLSRSREQKMEKRSVDDGKRLRRLKEEDGYRSDSSEPCEHTTVSTDSAFASEDYPREQQIEASPVGNKPTTGGAQHLESEARKLLLYFKSHRMLLNYLGIGLTESLWHHISALPLRDVQISIIEDTRQPSSIITSAEANIFAPTPPQTQSSCQPTKRNKPRREERSAPAQSPRLVALERQLRTDDLDHDWEDESRGCFSDGEGERREGKKVESRGGRFVKKSAAALIAKKQGYASNNEVEEPNSSEIIDPRIASEIRALREREEELRRSRTELGLPTLDDVMSKYDGRSMAMHSGLRSAHSYDQLHQLGNGMYCLSQSEHFSQAIRERDQFARSSATHISQKDCNKKNSRSQHDFYVNKQESSSRSHNKHSRHSVNGNSSAPML